MIEIRFHGKGGHGAVVASKFLADAAARNGYHAQSFASYGALRRGGRVESYVRISENPVRPHCKLYEPDWLVLMDDSMAEDPAILSGLKDSGRILVNSGKPPSAFFTLQRFEVYTVNAYPIAKEKGLMLPGGMPVINSTLLGALAALLRVTPLEKLKAVIREGTPKPDANIACLEQGFESVISSAKDHKKEPSKGSSPVVSSLPGHYPAYHPERMSRCHQCQICYMVCPSLAVRFTTDPFSLYVETDLCTGCGICIEECPRKAISWAEMSWEGEAGHD